MGGSGGEGSAFRRFEAERLGAPFWAVCVCLRVFAASFSTSKNDRILAEEFSVKPHIAIFEVRYRKIKIAFSQWNSL